MQIQFPESQQTLEWLTKLVQTQQEKVNIQCGFSEIGSYMIDISVDIYVVLVLFMHIHKLLQ